jgi:hypothetical protein
VGRGSVTLPAFGLRDVDQVEIRGTPLAHPGRLIERGITDQKLSLDGFYLPSISPLRRISIFQPKNSRSNIRRHMLNILGIHRIAGTVRQEDLDGVVAVAGGTLIERTLNAVVSFGLANFKSIAKVFTLALPLFSSGSLAMLAAIAPPLAAVPSKNLPAFWEPLATPRASARAWSRVIRCAVDQAGGDSRL